MLTTMRAMASGLAMALAALAFQGHAAQAQTDQQWDWCEGGEGAPSEQAEINACTQILNSGHLSREDRAYALYNRGYSYGEIGQYRRAIQDLDESIRLSPEHAETWYTRHLCKERLGDNAGAQADYLRAKQLDPKIDEEESGAAASQPKKRPGKRPGKE